MDYSILQAFAAELGFSHFTNLQEKVFQSDAGRDGESNLMVIGETSSGKTLIPILLYYSMLKHAVAAGEDYPKMLFVVPFRALAAQKRQELTETFAQ